MTQAADDGGQAANGEVATRYIPREQRVEIAGAQALLVHPEVLVGHVQHELCHALDRASDRSWPARDQLSWTRFPDLAHQASAGHGPEWAEVFASLCALPVVAPLQRAQDESCGDGSYSYDNELGHELAFLRSTYQFGGDMGGLGYRIVKLDFPERARITQVQLIEDSAVALYTVANRPKLAWFDLPSGEIKVQLDGSTDYLLLPSDGGLVIAGAREDITPMRWAGDRLEPAALPFAAWESGVVIGSTVYLTRDQDDFTTVVDLHSGGKYPIPHPGQGPAALLRAGQDVLLVRPFETSRLVGGAWSTIGDGSWWTHPSLASPNDVGLRVEAGKISPAVDGSSVVPYRQTVPFGEGFSTRPRFGLARRFADGTVQTLPGGCDVDIETAWHLATGDGKRIAQVGTRGATAWMRVIELAR